MLSQLGELAARDWAWATGRRPRRRNRPGKPPPPLISPPFWGCWAAQAAVPSPPASIPALLGRIAQVMSSLSTPDRDTQLLMALQPFCGEHRRKKVEEATQLLRIIRLLPLLEDKPPAG